ncbi:hypothetical protein Taro_038820 [Colocasia esculenta]|uniref:Uncharacterized protein n=1 Tax=Colocasia esculenta TaxID=4460 RepID=A0A843W7Q6_COLES|nr:hypothetical protein [Colocasia esculenta]
MDIAHNTSSKQAIVTVAQHAHLVLAVGRNSLPFRWPCYAQVQRFGVIQGYNSLVDYVGIHGQMRLTEALNKDSLVRQKEYPMESSSKSRECVNRNKCSTF